MWVSCDTISAVSSGVLPAVRCCYQRLAVAKSSSSPVIMRR
jgi:hypothetical protein